MSLCSNCPVPFEEDLPEDQDCSYQCSYQGAVYKIQQAYWSLFDRFEKLEKAYDELKGANS